MGNRYIGLTIVAAVLLGIFPLTPTPAAGQSRAIAARVEAPLRTPDGQPDIQGVWQSAAVTGGGPTRRPERFSLEDIGLRANRGTVRRGGSRIVDPADGKIPYQPWAAEKQGKILANHWNPTAADLDPQIRCHLQGVPRATYFGEFQILQAPGHVVLLPAFSHSYRIIPLDGRPHLGEDIKLFMGDSRGRWEGNTLVVDVTNNNDRTWLDAIGSFHSDALRVVERFTRIDEVTIHYEATIEDPNVYTRPWKLAIPFERVMAGFEIWEEACYEGERDVKHILGGTERIR